MGYPPRSLGSPFNSSTTRSSRHRGNPASPERLRVRRAGPNADYYRRSREDTHVPNAGPVCRGAAVFFRLHFARQRTWAVRSGRSCRRPNHSSHIQIREIGTVYQARGVIQVKAPSLRDTMTQQVFKKRSPVGRYGS